MTAIRSTGCFPIRTGGSPEVAVVNLISLIVSIIAGLVTIGASIKLARERGRITWRTVDSATKAMLKEIQTSSFDPEIVVGVGRGGAILAGMLAGNLGHL